MEYYVYAYLDPSFYYESKFLPVVKNLPIYIGKGKNNRLTYHWKEIISGGNLKNIQFNSKLKKMKEDGIDPIIIKIKENLDSDSANQLEKNIISLLGRKYYDDNGILLNVAKGGDGGITWIGENPFKGKTLEQLYGKEKSDKMKESLSKYASSRIGGLNHMFGIRGEDHPLYGEKSPLYGKERPNNVNNKISNTLKEKWKNMSEEDILNLNSKIAKTKENWTEDLRKEIGKKISDKNRNRKFSEEHREKLSITNYKKNNKGSESLKLKEESKKKISEFFKNRKFSEEHKEKLRKFKISYEDLKCMVIENSIKSKREYQIWIKQNNIDAPLNPSSKSFHEKWKGWTSFLNKKSTGKDSPKSRKCLIEGIVYDSIKEVQEKYEMKNHNLVRYRISSDKFKDWNWYE
jgi:hypothetical protein